jgi:hypothetical protein
MYMSCNNILYDYILADNFKKSNGKIKKQGDSRRFSALNHPAGELFQVSLLFHLLEKDF